MNVDDLVRLDDICESHFNLSKSVARRLAAQNKLPIPTFRLRDSQKAPLMVRKTDLAAHINTAADKAAGKALDAT